MILFAIAVLLIETSALITEMAGKSKIFLNLIRNDKITLAKIFYR